jgi:hypothetical protein
MNADGEENACNSNRGTGGKPRRANRLEASCLRNRRLRRRSPTRS